MRTSQTTAAPKIDLTFPVTDGPTLKFKRRPWITGTGYHLIYEHTNGSTKTTKTFMLEAEADQFAMDNNCAVTHRVILSDAEMRKADIAAGIAFKAYKTSRVSGGRRYSNCYSR